MTHIYHRRKPLSLISLFAVIFLVVAAPILTILLRPKQAEAGWYDDAWLYRKSIVIGNTGAADSDKKVLYQVDTATLITAGQLQGDCGDSRFTDVNGAILQYFVSTTGGVGVQCNDSSTDYYVLLPTINGSTNNTVIYHYYGNPTIANDTQPANFSQATFSPTSGPTAGSEEKTTGPVSYWNFDEGQGSTTSDWNPGSNNDLTITNAAWKTLDLCVFGNCLYFDGSTDYATKSYSADTELLPSTGSFTVSAWFKHTSTAGADTLISRADAVAGVGWKVYMNSSGYMCFGIDDTATSFPSDSACTTTSYADSKWHFVTAVKSTTASITIFIDGQQAGQDASLLSTLTLNGTNAPFTVGNDFDNGTNGWDGFIDEVKYYNFAKTASQITAEYASKSTAKGTAASFGTNQAGAAVSNGLIAWWKLDESSGNPADSSGNVLTLTNNGVTTFAAGKFANASSHNGTTQYFSTATAISGVQTVAFWVNPASTSDDYINLIASTAYINSSSGTISATGFTNPSIYINGVLNGTLTASVWNHIVVTTGTAVSATAFEAGRANGSYLDNTGKLDDVRVYNRALSPAEVSSLYNWAPGPVGWWKMDENTGTAVNDSSGNGYTGTPGGSTYWAAGKAGPGIALNVPDTATSSYVDMGNITAFNFGTSGSFTLETWYNRSPRGASDRSDAVIAKRASGTTAGFNLTVNSGNSSNTVKVDVYDGTNSATATSNTQLANNTWYHLAAVVDRNSQTAQVYINGLADGASAPTSTVGSLNNTSSFCLGLRSCPGTGYNGSSGVIDDARLYNYARTPKQIVEDMNAGHPAGGSPIGSQAVYWKFDEGQGTTANNSGTASSSNGTLTTIASPATSTSGWTFTGKVNKGIVFDGTNDNVVIATANDAAVDFATTEQFSAGAWVYVTTMPGSGNQDAVIAKWDDTGNLAAYKLYVENDDADTTGNFEVQIYDESASQAITASQVIDQVAVNTWYHVAFTFNGGVAGAAGDLKLYVDGKYIAQNLANASFLGLEDLASDFTVGDYDAGDAVANNTAFTGTIDEVKVYSGLLSQSEIQVDMNAGSAAAMGGVLGTQDNEGFGGNPPVGWWKLDENTGTASQDSSGNGFTLSPRANSPWKVGKFGSATGGIIDSQLSGFFYNDTSIDPADLLDFSNTQDFSFSFWLKVKNAENTGSAPFEKGGTSPSSMGYAWEINSSSVAKCKYADGDGIGDDRAEATITGMWLDNNWHFITCVMDRSGSLSPTPTYYMFIDGVLRATQTTLDETSAAASDKDLGLGESSATYELDSIIDEVKIYRYARTPAQIAYDYNRGAPVGWWKFDECQGATAYNAATNANGQAAGMNGTITIGSGGETTLGDCTTSSTAWGSGATGKYNASLDFDGTDDYVTVSDDNLLDFGTSQDFTLSAWVKSTQAAVLNKYFSAVVKYDGATTKGYGISLHNSTTDARWYCQILNVSSTTIYGTSDVADGNWHHLVCIRSGSTLLTYQDGASANSGTAITSDLSNAVAFLISGNATSTWFPGQIDDVRIFRYALTAGQIQRLYNEGAAQRFGPQTGSP